MMMMIMMMMMMISGDFTLAKSRALFHRVLHSKAAPIVALLTSVGVRVHNDDDCDVDDDDDDDGIDI